MAEAVGLCHPQRRPEMDSWFPALSPTPTKPGFALNRCNVAMGTLRQTPSLFSLSISLFLSLCRWKYTLNFLNNNKVEASGVRGNQHQDPILECQFQCRSWENSKRMAQVLRPLHLHERPGWNFRLLTLASQSWLFLFLHLTKQ